MKGFQWEKKDKEDWYELKVNLPLLNLDQSLKVQEMFDNKKHQKLQEKFNKMIVILTAFIVLTGVFNFVTVASEHVNLDFIKWIMVFGVAFLISSILFLYVTLSDRIKNFLNKINITKSMGITKQITAGIIFLAMSYVAFNVTLLFGLFFLIAGIYALIAHDAYERPGIPIIWLMGSLISRVALTEMLLPILRYENIIDAIIGLFAFGVVYLIGQKVKNS